MIEDVTVTTKDLGPIDTKYNMIQMLGDLNCPSLIEQMKRIN